MRRKSRIGRSDTFRLDLLQWGRLTSESPHGGWDAINVRTNRPVRIKSAQRLRSRVSVPGADETPKAEKAQREVATRAATGKAAAKATTSSSQRDTGEHAATSAKREAKSKQTGVAPRSQLTLEEADMLAKVRAGKKARKQADATAGPMGMVAAAAEALRQSGEPMRCRAIVEAMRDKGLWTSPNGKTPEATLHSAIMREINKAVETATVARFRKVGRGQFALNTGGQQ